MVKAPESKPAEPSNPSPSFPQQLAGEDPSKNLHGPTIVLSCAFIESACQNSNHVSGSQSHKVHRLAEMGFLRTVQT